MKIRFAVFLSVAVLAAGLFFSSKSFVTGSKEKPLGYLKHFEAKNSFYKKKFKAQIKKNPPIWAKEQIEEDFSPFAHRSLSLQALNQTAEKLQGNRDIVRYRIIDNQVYCSNQADLSFEPISRFYKALQTLAALAPLPNLDFLVNHADGTEDPIHLADSPEDQVPLFGWAKLKTTPYLILIPDYRSVSTLWFDDLRKLVEGKGFERGRLSWEEKKSKAFWRGVYSEPVHRLRIAELSQMFPEDLDAGLVLASQELINYAKPSATYEEHMQYKYLPVLDGVMCSYPGYQWRLLSDSVVLKQESEQIQWFYRALQPFVHYIPIQNDLSDLLEKIQWARLHDEECQKIAENGKAFALSHLLLSDIYSYLYLALTRYASLQDETFASSWANMP